MSLKTFFEQKKCFKLICGAGNENLQEVERLVALYAKAGCHFFDLCASEEVLAAAQRGLDFAIPKEAQDDYHFCVSIGTKNDPHFNKARIDDEKCVDCLKCVEICPQGAVQVKSKKQKVKSRSDIPAGQLQVDEKKCIGCMRCQKVCENEAIIMTPHPVFWSSQFSAQTENSPLPQGARGNLFPVPCSLFPSCIELHVSDGEEAQKDWQCLCENFDGMLSICIGRDKFSNEEALSLVKKLVSKRKPYSTIIQADGSPMSGGEDDFKTTLQAVAMAELIQNANLSVYVLLSGGTNSKTAELANLCGVDFNGVAVGSYARKIVKEYIEREDFFDNDEIFKEASTRVKGLLL